MSKMKEICPLCGGSLSWRVPFVKPEISVANYHWRCCARCGNGFPTQVFSLEEMQSYWNRNRVVESTADQESIWRGRYREAEIWAARTWEAAQPFMPEKPGRFLDIACGLGATAKFFQDRGWYAEGQDADPNTRAAHEHFGIKSTIGQIENIRYDEPFDFISIAHAIYFISNPVGFIRRVRGMLRPGGVFIVLLSDLLSAHSGGGPSYVHTWFPTGESLAIILEREGFVVRRKLRMKGSVFVIATLDAQAGSADSVLSSWEVCRIYMRHWTHGIRHILWGRPRRMAADIVKKVIVQARR